MLVRWAMCIHCLAVSGTVCNNIEDMSIVCVSIVYLCLCLRMPACQSAAQSTSCRTDGDGAVIPMGPLDQIKTIIY